MKLKVVIIGISSLAIIGIIVTLSIIFPLNQDVDSTRFQSEIIRDLSDDELLLFLTELENLSSNSTYFNSIKPGNYHLNIENITLLIEREESFLASYDSMYYSKTGSRYHKFIYNGIITQPISYSEFIPLILDRPSYIFYQNYTTLEYTTITSFNQTTSNQSLWGIEDIIQYVFSFYLMYIFINQTVVISDVYAPLAGTGTQFQRFIICEPSGYPLFFISDEGLWWIS